jgi:hypothetical protein
MLVVRAVAREERHPPLTDDPEAHRCRRRTERRVDVDLFDVLEQLVEPGPAEDADLGQRAGHQEALAVLDVEVPEPEADPPEPEPPDPEEEPPEPDPDEEPAEDLSDAPEVLLSDELEEPESDDEEAPDRPSDDERSDEPRDDELRLSVL